MGAVLDAFKEMDKKTLWWLIGGLGGIVVLILILNLASRVSNPSYVGYETVEENLVEAAKRYFNDNQILLPSTTGNSSMVTLNTLVVGEYIKPLNKYLKNGDSCDASVSVTKLTTDYDYTPYLNCGADYTSVELYKRVLEDNTITTSGAGLYGIDYEKVFRGEVKNNFVSLNNKLWRIVKIDSNNNVVLISNFNTDIYEWDDRYNQELDSNDGINNYELSRIKDAIEADYNGNELLTEYEKSKVVYLKACVGGRGYKEEGHTADVECKTLTETEVPVRLLTVGEFIEASIDANCKIVGDKGCTNYNYLLDKNYSFWSMTKGEKDSSQVYVISNNGISESRADISRQVRYVISLSPKAFYEKGSGTEQDPYIIKTKAKK